MAEDFDSFFRSMVETLAVKLDIPIAALTNAEPLPVGFVSLARESLIRTMRKDRPFNWIDPTK